MKSFGTRRPHPAGRALVAERPHQRAASAEDERGDRGLGGLQVVEQSADITIFVVAARGTSLIWISHDLSVVAGLADEIAVMYAGRIVEHGTVDQVLDQPQHPYTQGLIGSLPSANSRTRRRGGR